MIKLNIEVDTIDELHAVKLMFNSSVALPMHAGEPINHQLQAYAAATALATAAPITIQAETASTATVAPTAEPAPTEGAVSRRRRTKAEMEAARAAEVAASGETSGQEAPSSEETAAVEQPQADEQPEASEVAAAPVVEEKAPVAEAPKTVEETKPDTQPVDAWTMASLRERIGGLQTYVASERTLEILSGFGITVAQIGPAPGATITPVLNSLNAKNLSGLIDSGAANVNKLVAIYDALMKG